MIRKLLAVLLIFLSAAMISGLKTATGSQTTYDTTTLAGKLASVNNTPGLLITLSGFLQQEADMSDQNTNPAPDTAIAPSHVLNSSLDGITVKSPDVTVNQDTAAATQNEPVIAVDPNNANRLVAGTNDYITRTWSCMINGTPCSGLGDGYSGAYYSNDGGHTWCCIATDPQHLGTLIPGVERLTGGIYDAGGDANVFFDNHGNVYLTGLGFDRTQAPNTVTLSKGTFDASGNLHWGPPTFIGQTKSPSTLNDKPWSAIDNSPASPFYGRIYISWTRFIFNPSNGAYKQSPIIFAYSTDGGVTWTPPTAIAPLVDIRPPANTVFRVNSFPAGAVAPNGDVYAAWSTEALNTASTYGVDTTCFSSNTVCHAALYWSKSTNAGATWSTPQLAFPALDASSRTAIGYPQAQPSGGTLKAPAAQRIDTFFPAVAIAPNGNVYVSSYAADVVSPWQTCAQPASPTAVGRINCLALGNYINNARLDYVVTDLTTGKTQTVTTHPINSRYQFGGSFIGDYTDLAVDSNNNFQAVWADTNNQQTVVWWYGFEFVPTKVHQQDIVSATGSF